MTGKEDTSLDDRLQLHFTALGDRIENILQQDGRGRPPGVADRPSFDERLQHQFSALGDRLESAVRRELKAVLAESGSTLQLASSAPSISRAAPRQRISTTATQAMAIEDSLTGSRKRSSVLQDVHFSSDGWGMRNAAEFRNEHSAADSGGQPASCQAQFQPLQCKLPQSTGHSRDAEVGFKLMNRPGGATSDESDGSPANTPRFSEVLLPETSLSGDDEPVRRREHGSILYHSRYGFEEFWKNLGENPVFEVMVALLIMLNAIVMAIETDYSARYWQDQKPHIFYWINTFMCLAFATELAYRMSSQGWNYFSSGLNIFDIVVVAVQWLPLIESMFKLVHGGASFFHVSPVAYSLSRVLRMFSILRLARVMRSIHQLRLLLNTIYGSLSSLTALIFGVAFCTFVFGLMLTQMVTNYVIENPEGEGREELQHYYGTLDRSMLSLYEAMCDGIHWHEIMEPLVKYCSPFLKLVFVAYTAFTMLALMNILQGLFLESAMRIADIEAKDVVVENISKMFTAADIDGSGTMSALEFERMIDSDGNLLLFLQTLEIRKEQAMQLFMLLDTDGSGEIDMSEFLYGIERLQGGVKAIDFAAFMCEWWTFKDSHDALVQHVMNTDGGLDRLGQTGED